MKRRSLRRSCAELCLRGPFATVLFLGLLAGFTPAAAQFTGSPLLPGSSAGSVEGGSSSIAGALATADLATGTAHAGYAFRLETVRGEVQPALALSYSSTDGQREAGLGWGLGYAAIERHNDSGGPRYSADPSQGGAVTSSTDRFVFGGAPLVPICRVEAGKCSGMQSGESLPSWAGDGWNYFRLAVDTSYDRFFWSPNHQTWVVQSRSGETREYGIPQDGSGRTGGIDKDNGGYSYRWNLVRSYDTMGANNEVIYVWQQLYNASEGTSPIASLTDIYDTSLPGAPSALATFAHHTQLIWEVDPAAPPAALQPRVWHVTPVFRLQQVNVFSMTASGGGNRMLVRSYALSYYAPGSQSVGYERSLLQSVQMTGACPNVSDSGSMQALSLSCASLPAETFTYNSASAPSKWTTMSHQVAAESTFVDIDGDGYPDAVSPDPSGSSNLPPQIALNNHGTGFGQTNGLPVLHTGSTGPAYAWFASTQGNTGFAFGNWGQISGPATDGFYDATADNGNAQSGFFVPQQYQGSLHLIDSAYGPNGYSSPPHPWCISGEQDSFNAYLDGVSDLDGDGIPDCWAIPQYTPSTYNLVTAPYAGLTQMNPDGSVHPYANTHYPAVTLSGFNLGWNPPLSIPSHPGAMHVFMADVTGDGIPDLVWLWNQITTNEQTGATSTTSNISVIAGNGDGSFGNGFTIPMPVCQGEWPSVCSVSFLDLNGDGYADLVAADSQHTWIVLSAGLTSKGIQWGKTFNFPAPPFDSNTSQAPQVFGPEGADLQGTGITDLIFVAIPQANVSPTLGGAAPGTVYAINLLNNGSAPLLQSIDNGLGAKTVLTYDTTAHLGYQAKSTGHPWGWTSTQTIHVVTSITTTLANNIAAGGPLVTYFHYQGASNDSYAGAMYDKRFRRFNGFGFVRTYQSNGGKPATFDVTDTYFEPALSAATSSSDVPWDAVRGMPVFSSRYAISQKTTGNNTNDTGHDSTEQPPDLDSSAQRIIEPFSSSHTTYHIVNLYKGVDGRIVRQIIPETSDLWVYDPNPPSGSANTSFSSLKDVADSSGGAVSLSSSRSYQPLAWPSAHQQSSISVDRFGNLLTSTESGILGQDQPIVHTLKWAPADNVWIWRPTQVSVSYAGASPGRQLNYSYYSSGKLFKVTANLTGTLSIRTSPSRAPAYASPMSDATLPQQLFYYDPNYGNLISTILGLGQRSMNFQYDSVYQQQLTGQLAAVTTSTQPLTTTFAYDRGLEVPTQITGVDGTVTRYAYDLFGRITTEYLPNPASAGTTSTQPDLQATYTDNPGGPFQRIDIQRNLGRIAEGHLLVDQIRRQSVYSDAMGQVAAILSNGGAQDPPAQWIASGITQRDARGQVVYAFNPFFATLTDSLPGATPPSPATAQSSRLVRDPFERVTEQYDVDGTLLEKDVLHDSSMDAYDTNDLNASAAAPTYTTVRLDGHGRPVEVDQRTGNGGGAQGNAADTLTMNFTWQATGEMTSLTRGSSAQGTLYSRWMLYDSLGRLVLNAEPNTSTGYVPLPANGVIPAGLNAWRYAYDDIGELVGTEDARGCGANFAYDMLGRQTAQTYVPCASYQPAYTGKPDVVFTYDAPESGEPAANMGTKAFLVGRLAATRSRGEHTQYAYDGRGRLITLSRQMPNPPGATFTAPRSEFQALIGQYAPAWYQTAFTYDIGDRLVGQTTGTTVAQLQGVSVSAGGASSTSMITTAYDLRDIPTQIGGSYGVLASAEQRDAGGRLLARSYGDLAQTTLAYLYDSRNRLQAANITRAALPALWSTSVPGYPVPNTSTPTTPLILQKLNYNYDAASNPTLIGDLRSPSEWPNNVAGPLSTTLAYDDLYRLSSVNFGYPPFTQIAQMPSFVSTDPPPIDFPVPPTRAQSQQFSYDVLSNTTSSSDDVNAILQRSSGQATYGAPGRTVIGPNQLAGAQSPNGAYSTTYDAAGNLTSITATLPAPGGNPRAHLNLAFTYQWDEMGRLQQAQRTQSVTTGFVFNNPLNPVGVTITNNYLYDGSGSRTWRSSTDTGSAQYFLDVFPSLRVEGTAWGNQPVLCPPHQSCLHRAFAPGYVENADNEHVYLISGGASYGSLLYGPSLPSPSQNPLHTLLEFADPRGSAASVIDKETGELVEQISYLAQGQTETDYRPARWNSFRESRRYSGKHDDYEVGLVYFGARYYVPGIGRWASPDPMTIHAMAAGSNPYSFVKASPYRYLDPAGLDDEDPNPEPDAPDCEEVCVDPGPVYAGPFGGGGSVPGNFAPAGGGGQAPPPPPPAPAPVGASVSTPTSEAGLTEHQLWQLHPTGGFSIPSETASTLQHLETAQVVVGAITILDTIYLAPAAGDAAMIRMLPIAARILPTGVTSMLLGVGGAGAGAAAAGRSSSTGAGTTTVAAAAGPQIAQTAANTFVTFAHGGHFPAEGTMVIPEGTTVTFVTQFGNSINTGQVGAVVDSLDTAAPVAGAYTEGAFTALSGTSIPNMFLGPPGAANTEVVLDPRVISVTQVERLSEYLKPNMGHIIIGACTEILTQRPVP